MRKSTFKKLDLAAQRIADRLLAVKETAGFTAYTKPYMNVKQTILDNKKWFARDMEDGCSMENVCKTTRQLHYLSNEVLHRLRRGKFFDGAVSAPKPVQMTFQF